MLVDVKQVELAPQAPVVALLGLFEHREVVLQIVLARPGGAVDALQHLVAVVTAPIGPGHLHQLEVLEFAGAWHVGSAAQVFEAAFAVQAHFLVLRNALDDLRLVVLAQALEILHGFVTRQHAAHHGLILGSEFRHALFDGGQVLGRERTLVAEVVVEAVFDHRADGDLRIREQLLDGVGQQVGGGVADDFQPLGVFGCEDGEPAVTGDGKARVDHLVVHLARDGGLGQSRSDRGGNIGDGDGPRKLALRTVGERDLNHGVILGNRAFEKQKSAEQGSALASLGKGI